MIELKGEQRKLSNNHVLVSLSLSSAQHNVIRILVGQNKKRFSCQASIYLVVKKVILSIRCRVGVLLSDDDRNALHSFCRATSGIVKKDSHGGEGHFLLLLVGVLIFEGMKGCQ